MPYVPLSHPFVEWLIGAVRREPRDRTLPWNAGDLDRKVEGFEGSYSEHRVHSVLAAGTPAEAACDGVTGRAGPRRFR